MESGQSDSNLHLEKVKRFHDLDAGQYARLRYRTDTCEGLAYVTRKDLVLSAIGRGSGKVLDIGCGPGIMTRDLIGKDLEVYSADLSLEMIRQAKEKAECDFPEPKAFFVASDISRLCFSGNRMDHVLCVGVVCYVTDYKALLSEIYRVLKPGGSAVIQIDHIRWPALYRRLVPFYRYLKSRITSKKYDALDFEFNLFPWHIFLKDLKARGFHISRLSRYDFRVPFLDLLLPGLSVRLGFFMYKRRSMRLFRHLAHGLLIECRKTGQD